MNAPKVNTMVQSHLVEHGQLLYDVFIQDFVKVVVNISKMLISKNKNTLSIDTTYFNVPFNFRPRSSTIKYPNSFNPACPI